MSTTMWKTHLAAYLRSHPHVPFKTAQKRASKTYQKMKKEGMAKTMQKSFYWVKAGKETINSETGFRAYLEKHQERILARINRNPEMFELDFRTNCVDNLAIFFQNHLEPGAVFAPWLRLGRLCQIFYDTFKPRVKQVPQKGWWL